MTEFQKQVRAKLMASAVTAALMGLTTISPAWAQAQDEVPLQNGTSATETGIQEIIVTAQRREEPLQDVPISVSVVSGEQMEAAGIRDITDIARSVPGMSFDNSLPGRSNVSIRGIVAASGDPTVGVYMDEYSIPGGQGGETFIGNTDVRLWDIDRVEVLRGPQGTLYGAGSMGGTVRFISPTPSLDTMSARIQLGLSNTRYGGWNSRVAGAVGGPLIDGKLGARMSAFYERQSGYIDRVDESGRLLEKDANHSPSYGARLAFQWEPDDSWKISPSFYLQKTESGSDANFSSNRPRYQKIARIDETIEDGFYMGGLNIQKRLGGVDIVSVTSYFDRQLDLYTDYTDTNMNPFLGIAGSPARALTFRNTISTNFTRSDVQVFSQEVRISSNDAASPVRWLVGAFYSDIHKRRFQVVEDPNFNANAAILGVPERAHNDWVFYGITDRRQDSYALFGDVSYDFTDKLTVSAGIRGFKLETALDRTNGGLFGGGAPAALPLLKSSEEGYNPRFTVDYKVAENSLLYATASKGFRAGGPNSPLPTNACVTSALEQLGLTEAPPFYKSDSLWNYEIGSKNTLFGNRVLLNAAAYYVDWSDIPQSVPLISADGQNCGFTFTGNVGKSSVRGAEIETQIRLLPSLTLSGNLGYVDAKVEADAPTVGAAKGERIQSVPRWTYAVSVDYRQSVASDMDLTARIDHVWRDDARRNFFEDRINYFQESYGTTNLSMGLEKGPLSAEVYVRNLFDRAPIINDEIWLNTTSAYAGYRNFTTLRPRTIGLTVNYKM